MGLDGWPSHPGIKNKLTNLQQAAHNHTAKCRGDSEEPRAGRKQNIVKSSSSYQTCHNLLPAAEVRQLRFGVSRFCAGRGHRRYWLIDTRNSLCQSSSAGYKVAILSPFCFADSSLSSMRSQHQHDEPLVGRDGQGCHAHIMSGKLPKSCPTYATTEERKKMWRTRLEERGLLEYGTCLGALCHLSGRHSPGCPASNNYKSSRLLNFVTGCR
jgi:hypothetical protein